MADPSSTQLRLVYSLLKPAVSAASRFRIPMRTVSELTRLAYYEHLRRSGLSQGAIGKRLGQSERHMRSLEQRLKGDFFEAEKEVGLVREVENELAREQLSNEQLHQALSSWETTEIDAALEELRSEGRVETSESGRLRLSKRYVLLASDKFHHRIDALNHFLSAMYRALTHRLVHDNRETAMLKTITFSAPREHLIEFTQQLEAEIRLKIAALEEQGEFLGETERYSLGLLLAPLSEVVRRKTSEEK